MGGYIALLRGHPRPLAFGLILMALASFGQTFFIALFNPEIARIDHLDAAGLGTAYAVATIGSALTLRRVGTWIDRMSAARYAAGVAALLAAACIIMGAGSGLIALVLAYYGLRLGGRGLMPHTAMTATARRFHEARGKALGVISLGLSAGEAILPGIAIGLAALAGWRSVWFAAAAVTIAGTAAAILLLPPRRDPLKTPPRPQRDRNARFWRDPRIAFTMPAILASPFLVTGFFFQQTTLIAEKHWSLGLWASMFLGYAIARSAAMLLVGPMIDRFGAIRILPAITTPLALAMIAVAFIGADWGVAVFLVMTGASNGITDTMATALWTELFGPDRLGEIRSGVDSASVLATALAPMVMGVLIEADVPLSTQAMFALAYIAATTTLAAWFAHRQERG